MESKRLERIASQHNPEAIVVEKLPDTMDALVLAKQRDLAIDALNRKTELLFQISEAMLRLDESSYGTCLKCGTPERRLNALPWVALCLTCQEIADGHVQPHLRPSLSDVA